MWKPEESDLELCGNQPKLEEWMGNYANVLCINSWQVKRYIDVYSASSVIGFSSEDLSHISNLQSQAEEKWSNTTKNLLMNEKENCSASLPLIKSQIRAYSDFLSSVVDLARSKWTEFNLSMMAAGLGLMTISLFIHLLAIMRLGKRIYGNLGISFGLIFAAFIVVVRAGSFLSNSYILEEGKVANFLLATISIVKLRYSISKRNMLTEAIVSLFIISILRFAIEIGLSKQAATSAFLNTSSSWVLGISPGHPLWICTAEVLPMLALVILTYLLYKASSYSRWGPSKCVLIGSIPSYMLITMHWALESNLLSLFLLPQGIGDKGIPKLVYAIGFGQLLALGFGQSINEDNLGIKTVAMLSACSSTIILLAGKQGSLFALTFVIGGFCIMRLANIEHEPAEGSIGNLASDHLSVTQWSLFAVCLFFSTGHWCAFDGLRYGAAFVGFDEFKLIRQAILLTIDTFGFSHILPISGLPVFIASRHFFGQTNQEKTSLFMQLSQTYLIYGLITAATTTATILCVTIQRRHLMVWGLFAPKFVFDVVGLLLSDILILFASLYYFARIKNSS